MSGFGSFSTEAYDQLRSAYAAELLRADEQEAAGVTIGQDTLGVETAPVKNAWLEKTGLWQYPDGKGEYQDVEQKQQDLLAVLRNKDGEVEINSDEEQSLDQMSGDEIDDIVKEVLAELKEEDAEETEDDSDLSDLSDEELDALIDEILAETENDEEAEAADLEDGEEPSEEVTAEDIAARIAELKAELAALTESEEDEAPEETEGDNGEETETEVLDDTEEEEIPSDDESN
jgi:ribosomal protein L29